MGDGVNNDLYERVVEVSYIYLGPAADRFIARQIHSHLNKEPEQLQKEDLVGLIDWISLAMAVLVQEEELISQYQAELKSLAAGATMQA